MVGLWETNVKAMILNMHGLKFMLGRADGIKEINVKSVVPSMHRIKLEFYGMVGPRKTKVKAMTLVGTG